MVSETRLADYWDISQRTLQRWRSKGCGPEFVRIGGVIRYPLERIQEYEQEHRGSAGTP
ncbi:helix-turn-helix domain-containing protein [Algicella marina]|uniref:Helix-turn-helix domain-containing protein n=1 Tax=Algicella marina TaxID=2683284 RepID=A0A6P1T1C9_9RHOB|nr:helix-turn-helix domain-containing protein [Algicella marina]